MHSIKEEVRARLGACPECKSDAVGLGFWEGRWKAGCVMCGYKETGSTAETLVAHWRANERATAKGSIDRTTAKREAA